MPNADAPPSALSGAEVRALQLEQILGGFGDGVCAFDHAWRFTYCNRAAEAYAGRAHEDMLGRIYWEVVPSALGSPLEAPFRKAMAERITIELEVASPLRPDAFVAVRAFPIDGGLAISFADITERRERLQRERDQAQRLELALSASGLGDWNWDPVTDLVTLSERAAAIFGIPHGPVMTWAQILDQVNPEDTAAMRAVVEHAFTDGSGYEIEYRITPPGSAGEIWVSSNARVEYGEDGRPIGLQGVVGDITRRKAQEAELRESEARFRAMANSAPALVWMTTAEGPIEFVNQAFADYAGKPVDELHGGAVWFDLLHPEDLPEVLRRRAESQQGGPDPYWNEARLRHFSGEWRWMRSSLRPRFDPANGAFQGYVGIAMDVTEIRAAEARQQLLINELNHRVKNTLATIQSIAHQTFREGTVTRTARALFTERLLALSTAHNVLTRENWESAELGDIVAEAVRPYDEPRAPRIRIEGAVARVAPHVALALSMAFHELATNATKYGALSVPEGRVALAWSIRADGRAAEIIWRESDGPPVAAPAAKGFGSRLLGHGLAAELGQPAALGFAPQGLVCTLTAPLAEG